MHALSSRAVLREGSGRDRDIRHSTAKDIPAEIPYHLTPIGRAYYVYILSNQSKTLYIGVTNDLERRVREHKGKSIKGFTRQYNVTQLVQYDEFPTPSQAIEREKKLKGWSRAKKIALVESNNPRWEDWAADWT